jgi:hypothetical protein
MPIINASQIGQITCYAEERSTMKLKANFVRDWLDMLDDILKNQWGYDTSGVPSDELPYLYFNAEKRRPDARPRKVEIADTFSCPSDLQEGWNRFRSLVESGADITAHLSKRVIRLKFKDLMLNDWGVHHFHLGEATKGYRASLLLFALVTNKSFHALGFFPHDAWADANIVETIHRNWPDVIAQFQFMNCEWANITEAQRRTLRARNANSLTAVSDGTVYLPPGGGVSGAGYNFSSTIRIDRQIDLLKNLEEHLREQLPIVRDALLQYGCSDQEPEIEARLQIFSNRYVAIFPKFNVAVTLTTKA